MGIVFDRVRAAFLYIGNLADRFIQYISSDPVHFLKFVIPLLLIFSFSCVVYGWLGLMGSPGVQAPMRDILAVPLMLFGVSAILGIIVFGQNGPAMFLSVFFLGTLVAGSDVAKIGAEMAAKTFVPAAAMYQGGGIGQQTPNYVAGAGGLEKTELEGAGLTEAPTPSGLLKSAQDEVNALGNSDAPSPNK